MFTLFRGLMTSGAFLSKGGAVVAMLVAIVGGLDWKFKEVRTAYALSVLEINFRSLDSEKQMYDAVAQWKLDSWGAQLGALRVVCETDHTQLDQFGPRAFTITLCRLVK
jgi:hypothetical protein